MAGELVRITPENEQDLRKGDRIVSPYTARPFEALRIAAVQVRATGRLFVRIPSLTGKTGLPGGWVDPTDFWFAPAGYRWVTKGKRWETGPRDEPVRWSAPSVSDLVKRDSDGWVTSDWQPLGQDWVDAVMPTPDYDEP